MVDESAGSDRDDVISFDFAWDDYVSLASPITIDSDTTAIPIDSDNETVGSRTGNGRH